jgi:hypothetical protein
MLALEYTGCVGVLVYTPAEWIIIMTVKCARLAVLTLLIAGFTACLAAFWSVSTVDPVTSTQFAVARYIWDAGLNIANIIGLIFGIFYIIYLRNNTMRFALAIALLIGLANLFLVLRDRIKSYMEESTKTPALAQISEEEARLL